jgi:hypothetical protein
VKACGRGVKVKVLKGRDWDQRRDWDLKRAWCEEHGWVMGTDFIGAWQKDECGWEHCKWYFSKEEQQVLFTLRWL